MKKKVLALLSLIVLVAFVFPFNALADSSPKWDYKNISKIEGTVIKSGKHKVGTKLEAGEYKLFAKDNFAYFALLGDSNGKDIIANQIFDTQTYVTVRDGQFLELRDCVAVKFNENDKKLMESIKATKFTSVAFGGTFKVGFDIPANEYEVESIDDDMSYWSILTSSDTHDIDSNEIFEGSSYVTVEDGQYLELRDAKIPLK
ncbi:hypothetical protein NHG25_08520 [Aerococcaceae bacterium NML191292]|nr:hypothetical protein [Aerococcaceae bacterium NML191292]